MKHFQRLLLVTGLVFGVAVSAEAHEVGRYGNGYNNHQHSQGKAKHEASHHHQGWQDKQRFSQAHNHKHAHRHNHGEHYYSGKGKRYCEHYKDRSHSHKVSHDHNHSPELVVYLGAGQPSLQWR